MAGGVVEEEGRWLVKDYIEDGSNGESVDCNRMYKLEEVGVRSI